jgi:hypothetical protein
MKEVIAIILLFTAVGIGFGFAFTVFTHVLLRILGS